MKHQGWMWLLALAATLLILAACSQTQAPEVASGQLKTLSALVVDTATDELDGSCSDGDCSLRDAIALASGSDTITFAPALASQTIVLTLGELYINKGGMVGDTPQLIIDASDAPSVTVSGNNLSRVFHLGVDAYVAIDGLIITGGNAGPGGQGGGIFNRSRLDIHNSVVTGNVAEEGGGLYNAGSMRVHHTTISGNVASVAGGGAYSGIYYYGENNFTYGDIQFWYSTVTANQAPDGGGIYSSADHWLINSTVSGNLVGGGVKHETNVQSSHLGVAHSTISNNEGSGIVINASTGHFVVGSSIIANQASGFDCALDNESAYRDYWMAYNLDSDGSCGFDEVPEHNDPDNPYPPNISGGVADLQPLQLNAPGRTATHALGPNSQAIDFIPKNGVPENHYVFCNTDLFDDQRGAPRPSGNGCDIGAYEVQFDGVPEDEDGIEAEIDGSFDVNTANFTDESTVFSARFTDRHLGGSTSGEVLDRGELDIRITRNVLLGSIRIATIGNEGAAPARFNKWCGFNEGKVVTLYDRSVLNALCGSLSLDVEEGAATYTATSAVGTLAAQIPQGAQVKVSEPTPGGNAQIIEVIKSPAITTASVTITASSGGNTSTFKVPEGANLELSEPASVGGSFVIENLSEQPVTLVFVSEAGVEQPQTVAPGETQATNAPPQVAPVSTPADPVALGSNITATSSFSDIDASDTHTVMWDWGDGSQVGPTSAGKGTIDAAHTYSQPGVYTVTLTVSDGSNQVTVTSDFVVVYDPNGGFVTGGGWIDSPAQACKDAGLCIDAVGKANFGFVSKYRKGAQTPSGVTQFQFQAGALDFHSNLQEWLVVNQGGKNAQYKGSGTINGQRDAAGNLYKFMIWASDGPDTFRIRIWREVGGVEHDVYDNGTNQALGGGSIKIHTK